MGFRVWGSGSQAALGGGGGGGGADVTRANLLRTQGWRATVARAPRLNDMPANSLLPRPTLCSPVTIL